MSRWPHIARYLRNESGSDDDFLGWCAVSGRLEPAERAAADQEWADRFEWRLAQRTDEGTVDHRLAARWTDDMVYLCLRAAARARDEDPGAWVPQHVRRPDLDVRP
jgi:hypothetical protein